MIRAIGLVRGKSIPLRSKAGAGLLKTVTKDHSQAARIRVIDIPPEIIISIGIHLDKDAVVRMFVNEAIF